MEISKGSITLLIQDLTKKKCKCVSLITLVKQKEHTLVVPLTFVTAATKSLKQLRFN